jgi:transketolase
MRKQFTKSVQEILYSNPKTCLLLGDIGVFGFRNDLQNLPTRVYNIGILEQSTIGVAAGLAKTGMIPFVHTIAPFMVERALEQLKVDFGYQELGGNFISVGASYDYAGLGCTHHCPGDITCLLSIPNMQIICPGTSAEFDLLLKETYNNGSPTYFRLSEYENKNSYKVTFGEAMVIKNGLNATIVCYGNMLQDVLDATQNLDVTILYYPTIKPFDSNTLLNNFNETIIVCEPFYSGTTNKLITKSLEGKKYKLFNIGIPDQFLTNYGTKKEHDVFLKLDSTSLEDRIKKCLIS